MQKYKATRPPAKVLVDYVTNNPKQISSLFWNEIY